jgi:SAM-dependent methyltransferase
MREPYATRFREMIRSGAAHQDIHDASTAVGFATTTSRPSEAFIEREANRVEAHRRHLLPLLEETVGPVDQVLDVGCSTGGTTIAMALSSQLNAKSVIGVDPNSLSLEAARVRAAGYQVDPDIVKFQQVLPGQPIPFPDNVFDLVTCISVLEFISSASGRDFLLREIQRVTRPGGHIYVATPCSWLPFEYHSKRFLGNLIHGDGDPWSSSRWAIRQALRGCREVSISSVVVNNNRLWKSAPCRPLIRLASPLLVHLTKWQRMLVRKSDQSNGAKHVG